MLHCDSQSAIHLAKNQVFHARTKHIDVRFHKIRELVSDGNIHLRKIHMNSNPVDRFTKPVTIEKFESCLGSINIIRC